MKGDDDLINRQLQGVTSVASIRFLCALGKLGRRPQNQHSDDQSAKCVSQRHLGQNDRSIHRRFRATSDAERVTAKPLVTQFSCRLLAIAERNQDSSPWVGCSPAFRKRVQACIHERDSLFLSYKFGIL